MKDTRPQSDTLPTICGLGAAKRGIYLGIVREHILSDPPTLPGPHSGMGVPLP